MKVLMLSTDRTLLGQSGVGDAVARHQEYAKRVERLDILVLSKRKQQSNQIAANCSAKPLYFWHHTSKAAKFWQAHRYDLVVCQDPFITGSLGAKLKKKFGSKLIIHFHGDFLDNPYWLKENWRNKIYRKMAEKSIKQADSIRVVSQGIKQKLLSRGISEHDIYTISTPVNLANFQIQDLGNQLNSQAVLTVGRIVKAKDFPTLIKAAEIINKQVPGFEWQIAGDGPLLKKFKRQTKDQPYLKWLGLVNHDQLSAYYQRAAIVAMTSNNESFGKVFLEGAMAKKPAVATDTVGAQEIIQDGISGYIVPIGDSQAVADRTSYLLKQPKIAQQMGQQAFQAVQQKFGWQKNIEAIISMWHQTVGV